MAPRLKFLAKLDVVEDLAVADDPEGAVFVADRLQAAAQVDNAEAVVTQADVLADIEARGLWAAMALHMKHGGQKRSLGLNRIALINSGYSTHAKGLGSDEHK